MNKKFLEILKVIGVICICVGAVISLTLRKDLGDDSKVSSSSDNGHLIEQEENDDEVSTEEAKTEEAVSDRSEKEDLESSDIKVENTTSSNIKIEEKPLPSKAEDILLVNNTHSLPEDFEVELVWLPSGREQVAIEIYDDLQAMLSDGTDEGLQFVVSSGYRSISYQQEIWEDTIRMWTNMGLTKEEAIKETSKTLANPGESEHATGLAVDIVALDYQNLDEKQHDTKESKWLRENCQNYGFILRYPKGKEHVTGITYESWHFRYVGKEVATYIMENEITLEEYIALVKER